MKRRMLAATAVFAAVALLSGCSSQPTASPTAITSTEVAVQQPNRVIADAIVVPERYVDAKFDTSGTVAQVLVKEGDTVKVGDPLARLDTRDLELNLAQSKANLDQAQASYDKIAAGATSEEIAAQQAQVQNAQANLTKTRQGNYTAADIANAQAQLQQAEAGRALLKNPTAGDRSVATERVRQAETTLQSTRDNKSQVKTSADLAVQQAADALTKAQASYATAKANWDYVQETGKDPTNPETRDASGKTTANKLNDIQKRQYAETFVQAEAALHSAEKSVTDAQVAADLARQNEITSIQTAESQLAAAQAQLAALQNPDTNQVAQQQAVVDQARANLKKVQQGGTAADVAAAQASVSQQQANLEKLTTPPRSVDLAQAQGQIEAAKVALEQAERAVDKTTLRAPFAGTIAERHLEVGQLVSGGAGSGGNADSSTASPFVLADVGTWNIQTNDLGERDVVRFHVGSVAQLTFDALPDVMLPGKVTAIKPRGTDRYGDMTYIVTVKPDTWDERLRWNMSATVSIEVQGH